jgi:hypothetical protein
MIKVAYRSQPDSYLVVKVPVPEKRSGSELIWMPPLGIAHF